ncbi:MAG: hypothetical protein MHM6MM_002189 [Cercozoa sp. M6MM]
MDTSDPRQRRLLWLARAGLVAPLPSPWMACTTDSDDADDGGVYYFNTSTGESSWEHPSDSEFKSRFQRHLTQLTPPSALSPVSEGNESAVASHAHGLARTHGVSHLPAIRVDLDADEEDLNEDEIEETRTKEAETFTEESSSHETRQVSLEKPPKASQNSEILSREIDAKLNKLALHFDQLGEAHTKQVEQRLTNSEQSLLTEVQKLTTRNVAAFTSKSSESNEKLLEVLEELSARQAEQGEATKKQLDSLRSHIDMRVREAFLEIPRVDNEALGERVGSVVSNRVSSLHSRLLEQLSSQVLASSSNNSESDKLSDVRVDVSSLRQELSQLRSELLKRSDAMQERISADLTTVGEAIERQVDSVESNVLEQLRKEAQFARHAHEQSEKEWQQLQQQLNLLPPETARILQEANREKQQATEKEKQELQLTQSECMSMTTSIPSTMLTSQSSSSQRQRNDFDFSNENNNVGESARFASSVIENNFDVYLRGRLRELRNARSSHRRRQRRWKRRRDHLVEMLKRPHSKTQAATHVKILKRDKEILNALAEQLNRELFQVRFLLRQLSFPAAESAGVATTAVPPVPVAVTVTAKAGGSKSKGTRREFCEALREEAQWLTRFGGAMASSASCRR